MCKEYNGWSNRETWATKLWLDNDRGLYEQVREMASQHDTVLGLADGIEELFDELWGDGTELAHDTYTMFRDIGSIYRVDWHEIAQSIMAEKAGN